MTRAALTTRQSLLPVFLLIPFSTESRLTLLKGVSNEEGYKASFSTYEHRSRKVRELFPQIWSKGGGRPGEEGREKGALSWEVVKNRAVCHHCPHVAYHLV